MYSVRFNDEDLAANRLGELTSEQRERLNTIYRTYMRNGKWTVIFFVGFFGFLLAGPVLQDGFQKHKSLAEIAPALFAPMMIVGAILLVTLGMVVITYFGSRNLRNGRIREIEGAAETESGKGYGRAGNYHYYNLKIKRGRGRKKLFQLPDEKSLHHFKEGHYYRVYYVEHYPLPVILSAEMLDE